MTTLAYFALAFGLSWSGVLLVIGGLDAAPGSPNQIDVLFPLVCVAMLVAARADLHSETAGSKDPAYI